MKSNFLNTALMHLLPKFSAALFKYNYIHEPLIAMDVYEIVQDVREYKPRPPKHMEELGLSPTGIQCEPMGLNAVYRGNSRKLYKMAFGYSFSDAVHYLANRS